MGRLTDRAVRAASEGRHGDGDGLHLIVTATGRRNWLLRYQAGGRRRDMGLGTYPAVSLADARDAAASARRQIAQGEDPIDARGAARKAARPVPTFNDVAQLVVAEAQKKSTNAKVRYQWNRHLGPAYCASILDRPVNEITAMDIAVMLRPVWQEKPEVARKLYPAVRRVFVHARIMLRDEHGIVMAQNPAHWDDLKAMGFAAPQKLTRGAHPSLPHSQLPAFIQALRQRGGVASFALEFLILTNVRTDAVLKAKWTEFDLNAMVWTVPLANLKDRKHRREGFRVPLTDRSLEILRQMQEVRTSDYVFPGLAAGKPLSNMALLTLIKRMNGNPPGKWLDPASGRRITAHGFRATFRTWAEEATGFPHAVIEQAMGHQVGSEVERAYRRTDVLEKRRELMTGWASLATE
jgi:integrase